MVIVAACLSAGSEAWAQNATPAAVSAEEAPDEPSWTLHGGVAFGAVGVSFDDAERMWHPSYRLEFGLRVAAGPFRVVNLTPKVGLHATHVEGINPATDDYAYASVDLAVRATVAKWRVRPYFEGRRGSQTSERLDRADRILNFKGPGGGFGAGVEIPLSKSGRGVEIGVTVVRGTFDTSEFQKVQLPADARHTAIAVHVGWSGLFTGISLPWQ